MRQVYFLVILTEELHNKGNNPGVAYIELYL